MASSFWSLMNDPAVVSRYASLGGDNADDSVGDYDGGWLGTPNYSTDTPWSEGKSFQNSAGAVSIPHDIEPPFTAVYWWKSAGPGNARRLWLGSEAWGSSAHGIEHLRVGDGRFRTSFRNGGTENTITSTSGTFIEPSNAWHMQAFAIDTIDGSTPWVRRIHETVQTGTTSLTLATPTWERVVLGAAPDGTGNSGGLFYGLTLWSRMLTTTELAELALKPEPRYTSGATLAVSPAGVTGSVGIWDDPENGTVSYEWRLHRNGSLYQSGTGDTISLAISPPPGDYELHVRASNLGGYNVGDGAIGIDGYYKLATKSYAVPLPRVGLHGIGCGV